ncbi:glycosyltransferase family A protein [Brassicibacter mesophilus]|uniref:glycosyltransferase family A protein n=1 Tax=Brassicibacter mesophilus TaxID=745119 RepID=UPI003D25E84A
MGNKKVFKQKPVNKIIKNKNKSTIKKRNKSASSKQKKKKTKLKSIGKDNTLKPKTYIPGSKKIIIYSDFNTLRFSNKRFSKKWIEKRIAIFMKYTLKSLKLQTNQNFLELLKYEDRSKDTIEYVLNKYPKLPENIKFIPKSNFEDMVIKNIQGFDYLYLVRLDSDDLYHKSFIQQMHDYKHDITTEAIINQNGYIYDSIKKRLARFPHKSPNYYTLIYNSNDYIKGKRYIIPGGHPNVIKLLNHEIIKKPNYIRNVHSTNDSSTFRLANSKNIINNNNKIKQILSEFL